MLTIIASFLRWPWMRLAPGFDLGLQCSPGTVCTMSVYIVALAAPNNDGDAVVTQARDASCRSLSGSFRGGDSRQHFTPALIHPIARFSLHVITYYIILLFIYVLFEERGSGGEACFGVGGFNQRCELTRIACKIYAKVAIWCLLH